MFAQKQRADKLQQEVNELNELITPYDDGPDMPSGRVDYGLLTVPAFRARFFNRPLTPAEAEVIESEMGRIELAAETENARFDALCEAVEQLIVMESSCPVYSPLDADPIPLRWWVQFGKHTGTTAKELADEWDHLVAEAMAEEYRIDSELNSVLRTTVYNEAPTVTADVIFTDEGKLCVKLESSAGQEAWYGFSSTPDGKPRLVLLPESVNDLPF